MRRWIAACAVPLACAALPVAGRAEEAARPWAPFESRGRALGDALGAASVNGFESAWNSLLGDLLRARATGAPEAGRLGRVARRVAGAEPRVRGTRIAAEALARASAWSPRERALWLEAAVEESLAAEASRARAYDASDRHLLAALERYRRLGELRRPAWILGTLGVNWFFRDPGRADSFFVAALAARRSVGDSVLVARALNSRAQVAVLTDRPLEARGHALEALAIRRRLGLPAELASSFNVLSEIAPALGEADSALAWRREAVALASLAGDSLRVAEGTLGLARLLLDSGAAAEAAAVAARVRAIAASLPTERQPAQFDLQARHVEAVARSAEGRYAEAADALERVARESESAAPQVLGEVLLSLGNVWIQVEDPGRARPPLIRALEYARAEGLPSLEAGALNNLAIAALQDDDLTEARRLADAADQRAAEAMSPVLTGQVAGTIGQIAWLHRDLPAARAAYRRAAAARPPLDVEGRLVDGLNLAAIDVHAGALEEAERGFRDALELARRIRAPDREWAALIGLGDVAERRGDMETALARLREAAARIDTLRVRQREERGAVSLFARRRYVYEALVHLLGQLDAREPERGFGAEAFLWAERGKARSLLDLLERSGQSADVVRPLGLAEAQSLAGDSSRALLVYSVGDSSSTLWVVRDRAVSRHALPPAPRLRARVRMLRSWLERPAGADASSFVRLSRALHDTLLAPALPALDGVSRLVIVPDGSLALLPFEVLLASSDPASRGLPATGWTAQRFEISYAPSVATLAAVSRPAAGPAAGIVALADPDFGPLRDRLDLPRLPGAAMELDVLREAAGDRPFTALSGRRATLDTLLSRIGSSRPEVIHIATHGRLDEGEPDRSGLWLAVRDTVPELLSVQDVLRHRFPAELVTLSACETGLGRVVRGEGVLGLARAFFARGAASLLVTVWRVEDVVSAQLVRRFYEGCLRDGRSRARALADAKRTLIARPVTRDPYLWAGYLLLGDPGREPGR